MKRLIHILAAVLAAALLLAGAAGFGESAALPQLDDYFTERDLSGAWDASAAEILLTGETAETSSHVVSVEGGTVTILDGGVYVLSGALDDGCVVVDVKDDERVQLVLNGVEITSSGSPAIRVVQADKVFVTLAEGTENALTSLAFEEEGVDAVVYSEEDLTFNGAGALTIESPAGGGIDGKDDVKFASGAYVITCAGRAIDANDSVRIAGGDFTITSDGDAVRARHETNEALGYIYIWGGTFNITAGGGAGEAAAQDAGFGMMPGGGMPQGEMPDFTEGEMPDFASGEMPTPPQGFAEASDSEDEDAVSAKGFKASGGIAVLGGTFNLDTADDAFHADGDLLVFDGAFAIASGDDGLHADGTLTVLGGSVDIAQSSEGLEAEVIAIAGGDIAVTASDDGLNAASSTGQKESFDAQEGVLIAISGGTLTVNAEGDGIDSNGDLTVTAGTIVVSGSQNSMNGALDYNGTATISGGTLVAAGASGMAENFTDASAQPVFLVSLAADAGEITVADADGSTVLAATVEKSFGTVVVSCPELAVGETYTVSCGDASAEITLTDTVTGSDESAMAMPAMGGFGRQGFTDDE